MSWAVKFNRKSNNDFEALTKAQKLEILALIEELQEDGPAIAGAIQLRSNQNTWAVRFDNARYRMIYEVSKAKRQIILSRMQPRGVVYKGLRG